MKSIIGIDLGGTTIKGGVIVENRITKQAKKETLANTGGEASLNQLYALIDELIDSTTEGIGIGVPSVVDRRKGILHNVQNIKNWNEVHLRQLLETRYNIPVKIDNDANCFALGEKIFGCAKSYDNFVGLTLGTGLGGGIIQSGKLLNDANCGSGEFGELPYREATIETYCSSNFFSMHQTTGAECFEKANRGDHDAQLLFSEFGHHLGALIKMIVLTIDPEAIVFGGSIAGSFCHFEGAIKESLSNFVYPKSIEKLKILQSEMGHPGILGAASLCMN